MIESKLNTWTRFRERLIGIVILFLSFENAAVIHLIPVDVTAIGVQSRIDAQPATVAEKWLQTLRWGSRAGKSSDYINERARPMDISNRSTSDELYVIETHQKALELPNGDEELTRHCVSHQKSLKRRQKLVIAGSINKMLKTVDEHGEVES
jgi:hypothetical protein